MNKVIGFGVIGLFIYGAIRISKVKNVADSISTKLVNPRIHKISLSGMILRSEVKINNLTADSLTLTKPVITLSSNGKTLMQSKSSDEELTIKSMAQVPLEAYAITNPPNQGIVSGSFIVLLDDTSTVQQIQVQLGTYDGDVSLVNESFVYDVTTGLPQGFSYNRIANKLTLGFSIVTDPATLFGQVRLKNPSGQWSNFLKFVTN